MLFVMVTIVIELFKKMFDFQDMKINFIVVGGSFREFLSSKSALDLNHKKWTFRGSVLLFNIFETGSGVSCLKIS